MYTTLRNNSCLGPIPLQQHPAKRLVHCLPPSPHHTTSILSFSPLVVIQLSCSVARTYAWHVHNNTYIEIRRVIALQNRHHPVLGQLSECNAMQCYIVLSIPWPVQCGYKFSSMQPNECTKLCGALLLWTVRFSDGDRPYICALLRSEENESVLLGKTYVEHM